MRYEFTANYRDWELIAEGFDINKMEQYENIRKLGFMIECWKGDIPIYFDDYNIFNADYLKEISEGVVTPEPIFSIFNSEKLTFNQMLDAIQERIPGIVKPTEGDDNPYEPCNPEEEDME